jgi:hypothetical protein
MSDDHAAVGQDAQVQALARIHSSAGSLIVRLARGTIEKAELIEALGKIANDAESALLALGAVPF